MSSLSTTIWFDIHSILGPDRTPIHVLSVNLLPPCGTSQCIVSLNWSSVSIARSYKNNVFLGHSFSIKRRIITTCHTYTWKRHVSWLIFFETTPLCPPIYSYLSNFAYYLHFYKFAPPLLQHAPPRSATRHNLFTKQVGKCACFNSLKALHRAGNAPNSEPASITPT